MGICREGRRLSSATYNGKTTTYEYDHTGLRTKQTLRNGTTIVYHNIDGKTVGETRYNADNTVSLYMRYTFDASGAVIGISLWYPTDTAWREYYFLKNLQGDVLQVYSAADHSLAASYTYDAWGNILSATGSLAQINPFRYRSYYFDTDTWFYYLTSRYYDPAIGRFINADDILYLGADGTLLSYNLFSYCKNNPVMGYDPAGHFSWTDIFNTATAVTIAALAVIAIVGSGGAAAPPLLAAVSALAGTTVTAATATTVATGVAVTGLAVMGTAAKAGILESGSKQGKDYVQARNNKQANQRAQDVGFDGAEDLKDFYTDGNGSKFNMFRNRATEEIILIGFKGILKGIEIVTELFLK